ncbi:MAG: hypothetical protein ABIW47_12150 [Ginsengibacter sp.]|jgi:hypothetical protein
MRKKKKIETNCEKATYVIEKNKLTDISLDEDLELKIHLSGCEACRIFQKQSNLIDKIALNIFNSSIVEVLTLSEQYKKELQSKIDKKLGNPEEE